MGGYISFLCNECCLENFFKGCLKFNVNTFINPTYSFQYKENLMNMLLAILYNFFVLSTKLMHLSHQYTNVLNTLLEEHDTQVTVYFGKSKGSILEF